jgi:hypothetical protein
MFLRNAAKGDEAAIFKTFNDRMSQNPSHAGPRE